MADSYPAPISLYLIRHPKPAIAPGVCYGHLDVDVAEDIPPLAARLQAQLPASYALYASPLQRAWRLAEALGQPQADARLREIHFGEWEGVSFDDIGKEALDAWANDPLDCCPPGGESPRQMSQRVLAWWDEVRRQAEQGERNLVVVAHGGPLRTLLGHLLGMPPEQWLTLDFACAQLTRIDVHEWGNVLRWFNRE